MIRYLAFTLFLISAPAVSRTCPDGQHRQQGACKPLKADATPVAAIAAPQIRQSAFPGAGNWTVATASKGGTSGVSVDRVMDGYVLDGDGKTIRDVRLGRARYGVTMRKKDGSYGNVSNLTISRVDITASQAPIYLRNTHDAVIEDAKLTCTGDSKGIPGGVKIGSAKGLPNYNITIRRTLITDCSSSPDRKGYKQGDGIATERPDHDITISDVTVRNAGDGCLDLKSSATRLDNVTLDGCNWGLRAWAQGTAGTVRIIRVNKAAVQMKATTDWRIDRLYLPALPPSSGDVFADQPGGKLVIGWCSRPLVFAQKPMAELTLGPACRR